jgi:hypothetical protein
MLKALAMAPETSLTSAITVEIRLMASAERWLTT